MDKSNEGRRVELIHTDDPYTKLRPGAKGTYQFCMDQEGAMENQHNIKWDSGSNLSLLEGKDSFKFLDPHSPPPPRGRMCGSDGIY